MTLLAPWWLLLLLPVIALGAAYLITARRRQRYAVRFATLPLLEKVAPRGPGWRRHLPAAAFVAALTLLGFSAARPEIPVRVPHERATVILAIDVSNSMAATDVEPNRLDAAREAARAFIAELPTTFNVGVVAFAGSTHVLARPSTDRDAAVASLTGLTLADSTAIGEAVFISLDQIASMAPEPPAESEPDETIAVPGRIVLLSDGSNTVGRDPAVAAQAAQSAGVPVSTIAYGTDYGSIELDGRSIPVPADGDAMASLAEATNGQTYTATSGAELASVYEDIGSSIGWRTEPREITAYLAALAFMLLLATGAMSLRWFSRLP